MGSCTSATQPELVNNVIPVRPKEYSDYDEFYVALRYYTHQIPHALPQNLSVWLSMMPFRVRFEYLSSAFWNGDWRVVLSILRANPSLFHEFDAFEKPSPHPEIRRGWNILNYANSACWIPTVMWAFSANIDVQYLIRNCRAHPFDIPYPRCILRGEFDVVEPMLEVVDVFVEYMSLEEISKSCMQTFEIVKQLANTKHHKQYAEDQTYISSCLHVRFLTNVRSALGFYVISDVVNVVIDYISE